MMRCILAALVLGALSLSALAEPLVVGVQTHFAQDPGSDRRVFLDWMRRSGLASSRDEMYWGQMEGGAGELLLRQGAQRSQQVWASMPRPFAGLLVLDYGHPSHDAGGLPRSEAAREAFARYAVFAASQTAGSVRWLEIWNEWNLTKPGKSGDAGGYVDLARTTYAALKSAAPDRIVIAGSPGDDTPDWPWMRQAIAKGLLSAADGLAVHLYNHCLPTDQVGSDELAERLDALREVLARAGRPQMPIYVTEVGWPTHRGPCGIAETAAAAHTLRFLLEASVRPWVAGVWFYELQDGGDDASDREQRFGLLRRDGTEKPAGCALREFGRQLGARPFAFMRVGASGAAAFRNGDTDRWLLWTRGRPQRPAALRLAADGPHALAFSSPALCGFAVADLRVAADARSATVHLAPHGVAVVEVPAGAKLRMEELR